MITVKKGASLKGLTPQLVVALMVCDRVMREVTILDAMDELHISCDVIPLARQKEVGAAIAAELGDNIIVEKDDDRFIFSMPIEHEEGEEPPFVPQTRNIPAKRGRKKGK